MGVSDAQVTTPVHLIDTNVVWFFFEAGQKDALKSIANVVPLAVVEEVHQESLNHKQRGAEYRTWQASSAIAVRPLAVGGRGAACLSALRKSSNNMAGLGEDASIALAVEDPSVVFVTNDKRGHWVGAREVVGAGRVLRFWAFLRRTQEAVGLQAAVIRAVVGINSLQTDQPLWLSDWLAALPP